MEILTVNRSEVNSAWQSLLVRAAVIEMGFVLEQRISALPNPWSQ